MRTDVKVGLFLGIAVLLLVGWFCWPRQTTPNRTLAIGEMGRSVTVDFGPADHSVSTRGRSPGVSPVGSAGIPPAPTAGGVGVLPEPHGSSAGISPASHGGGAGASSESSASAMASVTTVTGQSPTPLTAAPSHPSVPSMASVVDTIYPDNPAHAPAEPPAGTSASPVAPALPELPEAAAIGREPLLHIVKGGQTLEQIAEEYYKDGDRPYDPSAMVDLLRQANPQLAGGKRLRAGTKLKVPAPGTVVAPPAAVVSTAGGVAAPAPAAAAPGASGPTVPSVGGREYKVQRGDTLYSIASKQLGSGKRWHEVLDLNSTVLGGRPEGLRPGQVLRLPG